MVGQLLADARGLTAPYRFAFVGSGVVLVALWPQLALVVHADEQAAEPR